MLVSQELWLMSRFRIIDLSEEISSTSLSTGEHPGVYLLKWTNIVLHGYESELLFMPTHASTHIDAPSRLIEKGKTIGDAPLASFIVTATVLDVSFTRTSKVVTLKDIKHAESKVGIDYCEGILLYTGFEKPTTKFPGLSESAAHYLAERRLKIVGIDTPSIDPWDSTTLAAHKVLLRRGIYIIENLRNLKKLVNKKFRLIALPLKIQGASASPARVIAILE